MVLPELATGATCRPAPKVSTRLDQAISLKQVSALLSKCRPGAGCEPVLRKLFGMKVPVGIIIDRGNRDVILVGQNKGRAAALDIDDLVVGLRHAAQRYAVRSGNRLQLSDPGVSIDPDPKVWRALGQIAERRTGQAFRTSWAKTCKLPMSTRILGVPNDCRMAAVMMDADYRMKLIANGAINLASVESAMDERLRRTKRGERIKGSASSRYWFSAGAFGYRSDATGHLIEKAQIQLSTEATFRNIHGKIVDSGGNNPIAERFACRFTDNYAVIARARDLGIYKELDDMFRWVAIGQLIKERRAFEVANFDDHVLMKRWGIGTYKIPKTLPGQARFGEANRVTLSSCGGVTIDVSRTLKSNTGHRREVQAVARSVLSARPEPRAVHWRL